MSDRLPADLGYLYENVAAQIIAGSGRDLYFHTWRKKESTHSYEIDFLIPSKTKVIPIEIKSSSILSHDSIDAFCRKYANVSSDRRIIFSQKDVSKEGALELKPVYMLPFFLEDMNRS